VSEGSGYRRVEIIIGGRGMVIFVLGTLSRGRRDMLATFKESIEAGTQGLPLFRLKALVAELEEELELVGDLVELLRLEMIDVPILEELLERPLGLFLPNHPTIKLLLLFLIRFSPASHLTRTIDHLVPFPEIFRIVARPSFRGQRVEGECGGRMGID
jgi:hypothetical protein